MRDLKDIRLEIEEQLKRGELQERCRLLLPDAPFTLHAHAWAARGIA